MKKFNLKLYLITSREYLQNNISLQDAVKGAIEGGATMVQLREKNISTKNFYELAMKIKIITDSYNIPLIINDRVDIALAVNASGVHLGQDDMPLHLARKILGNKKIIGISTHNLKEAQKAQNEGADYIGYGSIFSTKTKNNVIKNNVEKIKTITEKIYIPLVAIGGIDLSNIYKVITTNAKGICICSSIMSSINIKTTTEKFVSIIEKGENYEI